MKPINLFLGEPSLGITGQLEFHVFPHPFGSVFVMHQEVRNTVGVADYPMRIIGAKDPAKTTLPIV